MLTYEIRVMFFVIQSACEFRVIVMCDGRTSWDICGVTVPHEITLPISKGLNTERLSLVPSVPGQGRLAVVCRASPPVVERLTWCPWKCGLCHTFPGSHRSADQSRGHRAGVFMSLFSLCCPRPHSREPARGLSAVMLMSLFSDCRKLPGYRPTWTGKGWPVLCRGPFEKAAP